MSFGRRPPLRGGAGATHPASRQGRGAAAVGNGRVDRHPQGSGPAHWLPERGECGRGQRDGGRDPLCPGRYLTRDTAQSAPIGIANATFAVRQQVVWGDGSISAASDSTHFRSPDDQNIFTGCGALTVAKILGETAGVDRFRSKDAYARQHRQVSATTIELPGQVR